MTFHLAPYDVDADHLTEHLATEFERLMRAIESAKGFRLLIAQFNQQYYRDSYAARLAAVQSDMQFLYVERENMVDVSQLRRRLHDLAQSTAVIHVMELNIWQFEQRQVWIKTLNQQRERLACPAVLIFWLTADLLKPFALQAPDLWSWRAGVFDFTVQAKVDDLTFPNLEKSDFIEQSELQRRLQRIAELTTYLQNHAVSDALKASLLVEQGDLNSAIGELDEAMVCFQQTLDLYRKLEDETNIAEAQGRIADILEARGELDEALRIRTEEELPVYERLGDVRSRAVTQGKIADILQARGELDEALRIRTEEELPVYKRLGDVRSILVTQTKTAIILMQLEPPRRKEANQLLCQALQAAQQMRIPEAGQIEEYLQHFEMACSV